MTTNALSRTGADIDAHCTGDRWIIHDLDLLSRLIAIVAMGQATHAADIIHALSPASPALNIAELRADAVRRLSIHGTTPEEKDVSQWHRDGLVFETISWIAAREGAKGPVYLNDPHLSATTQGLDGLMIELDPTGSTVQQATIFEDKCSKNPRAKFRDEAMKTFEKFHEGRRSSELVSAAAVLIQRSQKVSGTSATTAAARILDRKYRAYRCSLAITAADDSQVRRSAIFKGYDKLVGIEPSQRVAATFVTANDLRVSFNEIATRAIAYIGTLGLVS
jgi:hypothetical protein